MLCDLNLAEAIEIHGPLDARLMQAALWQLTREAEALRVRFVETSDDHVFTRSAKQRTETRPLNIKPWSRAISR